MEENIKHFHLFNFDKTYSLAPVETLLLETKAKGKLGFNMSIVQHYSVLSDMSQVCESVIPGLQIDVAVFVLQAHESRLSINEENAGIGFARVYKALQHQTGDNVLIVIGGDDEYKDENEEDKAVLSGWARRKVSSQFHEEYLDGRKSFIFSWNKKHREIHEQALLHFFDANRKGEKFEPLPKMKITTHSENPSSSKPDMMPQKGKVEIINELEEQPSQKQSSVVVNYQKRDRVIESYTAATRVSTNAKSHLNNPEGTVLPDTRHGELSYDNEDRLRRNENWYHRQEIGKSQQYIHESRPEEQVQVVVSQNVAVQNIPRTFPWWYFWKKCTIL